MRVEDFYDDQLVFLDESAANEFTKDRKFGWSMVGCPAVKERDLRRSERWSILPAYTKDVVLSQEKDTLSTLERISEARIARHGLPAGLMTRLKDSVKTWRRAAS
jgi:hypothetical protein